MKVGKEGVFGAIAALGHRMRLDVKAWEADQDRKMHLIMDRLGTVEGISLSVDRDPNGNPFSRARVTVHPERIGLTAAAISQAMTDDEPSIRLRAHHVDEGYFTVDAMEMSDEEVDLACDRMIGLMTAPDSVKTGLMAKYGGGRAVDAMFSWLE